MRRTLPASAPRALTSKTALAPISTMPAALSRVMLPAGAVICVEPNLRVKEETSRRPPTIRTPLSPLRVICPAGTWIVVSTNRLPFAWSASRPPPCNSVSVFEPAVAGDRRAISPWPLMAAKPPAVVTIRPAAISRSAPTRSCEPPARLSRWPLWRAVL